MRGRRRRCRQSGMQQGAGPSIGGRIVSLLVLGHLNLPLSYGFVSLGGTTTQQQQSCRISRRPNTYLSPSRSRHQSTFFVSTPDTKIDAIPAEGDQIESSSTASGNTHHDDIPDNETYSFWEDNLSVVAFNMDLENLAQENPTKAGDALDIMEANFHRDPDNPFYVKPNVASYTCVIDAWVRFQALPSSTLVQEDDDTTTPAVSPYLHHPYNSQNNHHHFGAQQAQKWLDRLEAVYEASGDPNLKPNAVSYMLTAQKWAEDYAQDFTGESAERAEQVLFKMRDRLSSEDSLQSMTSGSTGDDVKVWSIVLEAWCKRAGKVRGAIHRAERLLTEMEELSMQQKREQERFNNTDTRSSMATTASPNIVTYTSFIGGLARSREGSSAEKAEEVLVRMKTVSGIEPDMVAYTAVLNCYAKASSWKERSVAAKRALEILDFMETQYTQQDKYFLRPNVITYSTAIKAIGNSLDPQSASIAESVLRRMYKLYETGTIATVKPKTSTYNALISALASHSRRIMKQRSQHHTTNNKVQQQIGLKNARRAEQLLVEMMRKVQNDGENDVEPNVRTWGAVISAWAESGQPDAGEQTQRVLNTMQELYDRGDTTVRPNFVCYTTAMAAMGNSALPGNDPEFVAKNLEAANKVEEILIKMEQEYESTSDTDKRPNTITYITAIDSFCKLDENNAAQRSQRIVDRMMQLFAKGLGHVRPSRIVFNSLINAWSRCPNKGIAAAQKAEEIFQWMEKQYRDAGDYIVKPDEVSLCGVLNAWANNAADGGARRAQQILDKIESMTTKERGFIHSTICHNIVIKAWGRSREPDAVQNAEAILTRLEKLWEEKKDDLLRPDVTTYSSVINCCAYFSTGSGGRSRRHENSPNSNGRVATVEAVSSSAVGQHSQSDSSDRSDGRNEAFAVAMRTFRKLCKSGSARPNNITYGTLFKAIANLAPMNEDRENLVRKIFEQCCSEGQVDSFVLSQVRNASPSSLYRELVLQPAGINNAKLDYTENVNSILKRLPEEWRRRPKI